MNRLPNDPADMPMTEFRERLAERMRQGPFQHREIKRERLTADEARALMREFAVIVRPGETLILRVRDISPSQVREFQDWVDGMREHYHLPFQTIVLPGDEMGVAQTGVTPSEVPGPLLPLHPAPGEYAPLAQQEKPGGD